MAAGRSLEDVQREILAEKQPSGEFAIVIQIGLFVEFPCSDGAARITGAALDIDGGWVAR
jgi:3-hydroxybutyrate dehydrogenase